VQLAAGVEYNVDTGGAVFYYFAGSLGLSWRGPAKVDMTGLPGDVTIGVPASTAFLLDVGVGVKRAFSPHAVLALGVHMPLAIAGSVDYAANFVARFVYVF
jgi:hypothetical protein